MIDRFVTYWSLYERMWLFSFCGIALAITLVSKDSIFGFLVFLSGVLCVVLVAKGSILNYPIGMVNTLGYAWLAWSNGLFGEFGLNLLFYFPMNVIGFFMWRNHRKEGVVAMRRLSRNAVGVVVVACAMAIIGLGFGLSLIEGQNTPFVDAATNVLSIAATVLMIRRYREQWGAYIILNVLTVIMWLIRAIAGSPEGILMIIMWSAYLVNAFYGWHNWTKGSRLASMQDAA